MPARFYNKVIIPFFFLFQICLSAKAQYIQQGPKLLGNDIIFNAYAGFSVALSADGNTAIVGGFGDNTGVGAAWVYIRSGGVWIQQGPKLVGSNAIGNAHQGISVDISADGNTVIIGGYADDSFKGAAWIFNRINETWIQKSKIVGSNSVGAPLMGISVAISGDGNTAIIGGSSDSSNRGAAWIFINNGGIWSQQGPKLVGTGFIGDNAFQGTSVSISNDGNTVVVGAQEDNNGIGAIWVHERNGTIWSQTGAKLVGSGAINLPKQGYACDISGDGNTIVVGGMNDNFGQGALWVFTKSTSGWLQQGNKLICNGNVGVPILGRSVSISSDGNTIVSGGPGDSNGMGAAWVFIRAGNTWSQSGNKISGTGTAGLSEQGRSVNISADASTITVGGSNDSVTVGASWMFSLESAPTINSFNPPFATNGATIEINGVNFNEGTSSLTFGGVPALSYTVVNATKINAQVGAGASGNINVVTSKGTAIIRGFVYNTATSVNNLEQGESITIAPNPIRNEIIVRYKLNGMGNRLLFSLFNAEGDLLITDRSISSGEAIYSAYLPSGIYYARLQSNLTKRFYIFKITKY